MGKEIRTRKIQKNIKMLDKSTIAAEHMKQVHVRTKECAGQAQREQSSNGSVEYAENKIVSAAGFSASRSVRSIKRLSSFSVADFKSQMEQKEEVQERKRQTKRQTEWVVYDGRREDAGVTFKPEKKIKTFEQAVHKPMGAVQKAQEAAKKNYVESKVSKEMAEKTIQNAGYTAKAAGHRVKIKMKTGASAVRAVIASTKELVTAVTAGGSATAFLLIFIILFGGFLYTVGGGNSTAVSPVSKEVKGYEPLIRKYANQYGIGEYVELLKAVMMQESGGRGLDPMQSSEGAFNKKYPRQPNGIKDPEYSIDCGVQELKAALTSAEVKNPLDMEHIKLALQGYNFGNGYILWAKRKYGGYTAANAVEFSDMMAQRMGWRRYGDKEYVPHVLRYYAFGRIPTGIGNQSIVQVALSPEGNKGGRPYWSWYGYNSRVSWCACFVSWCADQCGYIENGTIPKFSSCASGASWFKGKGRCRINGFSTFLLLFAYSYIFSVQYLWEPDLMDDETMAPGTEAAVERFHALSGELRETEAALEKTAL